MQFIEITLIRSISAEAISEVAARQFGVIYHETELVVLGSGVIG